MLRQYWCVGAGWGRTLAADLREYPIMKNKKQRKFNTCFGASGQGETLAAGPFFCFAVDNFICFLKSNYFEKINV